MTMSSREHILNQLRRGQHQLPDATPPETYRPMVPHGDRSALQARFVQSARAAGCVVYPVNTAAAATEIILNLVGEDKAISAWDFEHVPVPGLAGTFSHAGIRCTGQDAGARVGLTGADAGLAATGSLVVSSGPGRYRAASLLPPIHIAVLPVGNVIPDLESWWAGQENNGLEQTRRHSNIVIITGPSRTADIAMQLVMGMHGPRELHLILLDD